MFPLNSHPAGRHFLQIPGPTNVPDRVLRAIDQPTIDHRGPEFALLGLKVLRDIWNGDAYRQIRQRHVQGRDREIALCRECSYTLS